MIDQLDLMAVVEKYRGDAVVIPIFRAERGWEEVSQTPERDTVTNPMGKGSSFALGLALSQPDVKVILFDGDGSLKMNLGSLVTIANQQPRNLYHFVMDNGLYATTGGQPVPGNDRASFSEMARAAGYAASYDFDDLEEFATQAEAVLNQTGPVLVCVKTVPNIRQPEERALIMARRGPSRSERMRSLQQTLKKDEA